MSSTALTASLNQPRIPGTSDVLSAILCAQDEDSEPLKRFQRKESKLLSHHGGHIPLYHSREGGPQWEREVGEEVGTWETVQHSLTVKSYCSRVTVF